MYIYSTTDCLADGLAHSMGTRMNLVKYKTEILGWFNLILDDAIVRRIWMFKFVDIRHKM